ncbi:shikimate kinase [Myxosarcina sp. GI1]|uniref:shikimate kinase n=1 Tax=Myxosarcina sp. GI1 TaxID=1541065 RepID=UPI000AF99567|nr:shikimate kinase [Myxosarcina sp. GI1]
MNDLLKGVNVYLIGMMGTGKTTVGQHLARKLNYRFIDMDTVCTEVAGQSIAEIFATKGEPYFRELETKILAELSIYTRCVISTGGGVIEKPFNWSYLHHGLVIWLDTDIKILHQRLAGDTTRPLANRLETLLESRRSLYAQADLRLEIATKRSPEQIATEIINTVPTILKSAAKDN